MNDGPISVLIVDDHLALRRGVELLLRQEGLQIAGVAERADEALALIRTRRPSVVLLDIALTEGDGLALARTAMAEDPDLGILLYTGLADRSVLREAAASGTRGFALKAGAPAELIGAIRAIAAGGHYVDPRLASMLEGAEPVRGVLSPREREIFELLAQGLTGSETARRLHLSRETVRTHIRNGMNKLGAHTRAQALAIALERDEIGAGGVRPER